jgi:hypothetical protein
MSENNQPPKNIVPFPLTGNTPRLRVSKPVEVPEELAKLDGQPLASLQPDNNVAGTDAKLVPGKETANNTEFNLHPDGTLMKFVERPGFAPQCLLVDGAGRQFGVARNAEVADLIVNGVNALHLARVMMHAEEQAKLEKENPGGPPPALLLPPSLDGGAK